MMSSPPASRTWIFGACLAGFILTWLFLVAWGHHWLTLRDHWGIAAAMAIGSYVAGSTPLRGGTIGFPVLVLLFHQPAALGRDFSFAIQSVGLVSASIFILCRRQPLEWVILRWSSLGSLIGTPLGLLLLAPHVPAIAIKLTFAVVWASFGVLHLYRTDDICRNVGETPAAHRLDRNVGFAVGVLAGATVTAVTGVGVDMILYTAMVLLMRADLKVAIPTTVIVMAVASLAGIATEGLFGGVQPGVYANWLAAAPVVAFGAPFGAFVVNRVGRRATLYVVALLCLAQFLWTLRESFQDLGPLGVAAALLAVMVFNLGFEFLWRVGDRLGRRSVQSSATHRDDRRRAGGQSTAAPPGPTRRDR